MILRYREAETGQISAVLGTWFLRIVHHTYIPRTGLRRLTGILRITCCLVSCTGTRRIFRVPGTLFLGILHAYSGRVFRVACTFCCVMPHDGHTRISGVPGTICFAVHSSSSRRVSCLPGVFCCSVRLAGTTADLKYQVHVLYCSSR